MELHSFPRSLISAAAQGLPVARHPRRSAKRSTSHSALEALKARIVASTGKDRDLDRLISTTLGKDDQASSIPDYTSSVDTCLTLIGEILPSWHWHVGYGPDGILPYASLHKASSSDDGEDVWVVANAPTVPLALLHAAVKAMMVE